MHVYTFFRKDKTGKGTPVASPTYLEAVMLLEAFTIEYKRTYDLRNYHFDNISDCDEYCRKIELDEFYCTIPRILTNAEYKKLFGKDIPKEKNVYEHLDELKEEQPTRKVVDLSEKKNSDVYDTIRKIIKLNTK